MAHDERLAARITGRPVFLLMLVSLFWTDLAQGRDLPVFRQVAGEIQTITVRPGDTLARIGVRAGIGWQAVATQNRIENPNRIRAGQELTVDTRRIVPTTLEEGWVVNIPDSTLYVQERGVLAARYTVGLGRATLPTPLGSFRILFKETDEGWQLPENIEEEMLREGRVVRRRAQPSPEAALGRYWIQLSIWGYGFHDTPYLASVGRHLGYGCIRVGTPDIEDLFDRAHEGTRVEIVYYPIKVAVTPEGAVWVEAHPDVYDLAPPNAKEEVWRALERAGVSDRIDPGVLEALLTRADGIAQPLAGPRARAGNDPGPGQDAVATWSCLDCPPGPNRRVTFQIQALAAIELHDPFPITIRNDAGRVVFQSSRGGNTPVRLDKGASRNFVWAVRGVDDQVLPAGSYTASIRLFTAEGEERILELPLWVGR